MRVDELLRKLCPIAAHIRKSLTRLLLLPLAWLTAACTTIGMHDAESLEAADFGPREELRICVLADEGITEEDAQRLIAKVGEEFSVFGLEVSVPWVRRWVRSGFLMEGIVTDVWQESLEPPCDRLLALVGRNFGDFLWGLIGVEILGAVDTPTHSRGYVIAQAVSLNQIFSSPSDIIIHESYHFLGCEHGVNLSQCYAHIRDLKRIARANREAGNDFFPGVSMKGRPITSRHEANWVMTHAVRLAQLEHPRKSDLP